MILSALSFTAVNLCVRSVDHLPTFELVFFRSIGSVLCGFFILYRLRVSPLGNQRRLLLLRAIVGVTSLALFFKAIQMMPLGAAVSLRYLSPFFATLLAVIFLRERMLRLQWLFLGTAFLGVLLVKGFDPRVSLAGLAIILTSSVLSGTVYVLIRKIGIGDHPVVVVNYLMCTALFVGGIVSLFNWVQPQGFEWAILLTMGLFGFSAQFFMTRALQLAQASQVTPFKYSEVIFTVLVAWLVFGEYQPLVVLGGMAVIILSLLAHALVRRMKVK